MEIDLQSLLDEHAQFLTGELKKMIGKRKIKGKYLLADSISSRVSTNEPNISGSHELSFLDDGRFVDMGAGRMSKMESADSNTARIQGKGRKPKKWYSRTAYGIVFGRLLPSLIIHTQDATVTILKSAVEK